MTKKDYERIAQAIRVTPMNSITRVDIALAMTEALVGTNPRFNRERFYEACFIKLSKKDK